MIVLTVVIDETDKVLSSEGILTALKPTKREESFANGLLEVFEGYCMKGRAKEGSMFIRRPFPTNETEDNGE